MHLTLKYLRRRNFSYMTTIVLFSTLKQQLLILYGIASYICFLSSEALKKWELIFISGTRLFLIERMVFLLVVAVIGWICQNHLFLWRPHCSQTSYSSRHPEINKNLNWRKAFIQVLIENYILKIWSKISTASFIGWNSQMKNDKRNPEC